MRFLIFLLGALSVPMVQASTQDSSTQAPLLQVSNAVIQWQPILANAINVYKGNGEWIVSLPGESTTWTATESGEYFLVATDSGDWQGWRKSNTAICSRGSNELSN